MSLQSRLSSLITAIGADIKTLNTAFSSASARQAKTAGGKVGPFHGLTSTLPSAGNRIDFTVLPGTYIVEAWMTGYVGTATLASWGLYVKRPEDSVGVSGLAQDSMYMSPANTHLLFIPITGEITVTTAGTLSVWPSWAGLTDSNDRWGALLIPRDVVGPPGPTGPRGVAGDAPTTYTLDPWHYVGAGEATNLGVTFGASWSNYSAGTYPKVAFRKSPDGKVRMRGMMYSAAGGVAFTLPTGYRPPASEGSVGLLHTVANLGGAFASVSISPAGAVTVPAAAWIDFSTIEFDTDTVATMLAGPKGDTGDIGNPPVVVRAIGTTSIGVSVGVYSGPLSLPTETVDTDNIWNGTRFQPTRAGWYEITAAAAFDGASGTSTDYNLYLVKNRTGTYPATGTTEARDFVRIFPAQGENTAKLEATQVVYFNGTTDFVELFILGNSGNLRQDQSTFAAISVGAAGPAGAAGAAGATGATGAPGAGTGSEDLMAWEPLPIRTDSGGWVPHTAPEFAPGWKITTDGLILLRGRVIATAASGINFIAPNPFLMPDEGSAMLAGVNETQKKVGVFEQYLTAMIWNGDKAVDDVFCLTGLSFPSAVGGPLGKKVTPVFYGTWASDPSNPFVMWEANGEIRFKGSIIGAMASSGLVQMFSAPGVPTHARTVVATGTSVTISGGGHPDTIGLTTSSFDVLTSGIVRVGGQHSNGPNQVKVTLFGGFTKAA